MTCPICGEKTLVIDSASDCECVYRKRKCVKCNYKFITTEYECESNDKYMLSRLRNQRKGGEDNGK